MTVAHKLRLWYTCVVCAVTLALLPASAGATTYLPVSFQDLVSQADVIFVGTVVDVRPYTLRTRTGTLVKTRVTFSVAEPLYGTTSIYEVFDLLGGEADGIGLAVEGMPKFAVGDREVVFARRQRSINPIVGFTQGLLRVRRDGSGADRVFTLDGAPLMRPENIAARGAGFRIVPDAAPMTLADLRARIAADLVEARKR